MNPSEEIKSRLDIIDVVQEYIRLTPAGTNFKACCPFHQEKTPSFMVSPDKQIWHCFGCAEGGDIFSFVMKIENIEFPEALKLLANKAGVKLQQGDPAAASRRNRLLDLCDLTARFWHKVLLETAVAKPAWTYLTAERQLSEETIERFKLGFAPEANNALQAFLKKKGFSDEEMFLAGLTAKRDRGSGYYERFRGRIIFPISDLHGNIIGFGGRVWASGERAKELAKYINSPQTEIYNKSAVLFGLDKAKADIKRMDYAILVEGYMDLIAASQAGTPNVVAVSGTSLTTEQIRILKRYSNNLYICLDADLAGQTAAQRGIDLALQQEMDVKVIVLPYGKDPDECIKHSPQAWQEAVTQARGIMQYYWEREFAQADLSQPAIKKKIAKNLLTVISRLGSPLEREHWLKKLSEQLQVPDEILREVLSAASNLKTTVPKVAPISGKTGVAHSKTEILGERILALLLRFPEHLENTVNHLPPEVLIQEDLRDLYKNLIVFYNNTKQNSAILASGPGQIDPAAFQQDILANNQHLSTEQKKRLTELVNSLLLLSEKDFSAYSSAAAGEEIALAVKLLKQDYLHQRLRQLTEQIKQAENQGQNAEKLLEEFNHLTEQLMLL